MSPIGMDPSWRLDSPCTAESTEESGEEIDASKNVQVEKLQALNKVSWVDASGKTKRFYTSKMSEVITTLLELVAPNDAALLW